MIQFDDLHERLRELKNRSGNAFWEAFQLSCLERADELQGKVNNLNIHGEVLERFRIELNVYRGFATGELLEEFCKTLESREQVQIEKNNEDSRQAQVDQGLITDEQPPAKA